MRSVIIFSLLACFVWADSTPTHQLPKSVQPLSYDLALVINPKASGFSGNASIRLRFDKKTSQFWIHGQNLHVRKAVLRQGTERQAATYKQVSPEGVVSITLQHAIEPGDAYLEIEYTAEFQKDLAGLYLVKQNKHSYVYSQFEPIAARTCFPGFDEPRFKTPFKITLTVPQTDTAISNGLLTQETKNPNRTKTLIFETTPPLPTYLIAFAVGPFDVVIGKKMGKIPLRGIAPKGLGSQLVYALEETPKFVKILEDYFGISYPYSKLDIIAVPDFASGAMENAGAITFRDSLLLMNPKTAPVSQIRRFAEVMSHELAHQWFGNLVTMKWWDDIWLNEAFATWMATKVLMVYNPAYHADWDALVDTQSAMEQDSLSSARKIQEPILSHHDIYNAFDSITYVKGAAVIDMFENYIRPELFQKGVRNYLHKYANKNADTEDFIAELSRAADQNLRPAFGSFLTQPGVPLLNFQYDRYQQKRYLPLGSKLSEEESWQIPFCPQSALCQLLHKPRGTLSGFGFPANNGIGYYRFSGLKDFDLQTLNDSEKIVLIANLKASFKAGKLNASELLPKLASFAQSPNRLIAVAPMSTLHWLKDHINPPKLAEYAQTIYAQKPVFVEPEEQRLFEAEYLEFEANIAMSKTIREALLKKALAYLKDSKTLETDLVYIALSVLVQEQPGYFDKLTKLLFKSQDAIQRMAILRALAESDQALSLVLSNKLRKNEILTLFSAYMHDSEHHDQGFAWLKSNLDVLLRILPVKSSGHLPWTLAGFCSESKAQKVEALLEPVVKNLPGGPRELKGVLEEIRLCATLSDAQKQNVLDFFGGNQ